MKKIYNKIVVVLMAFVMLILVMPIQRVEASGSYTVYVDVPDGWNAPYIWTWNSTGDLFDAWPGKQMVDDGNGWYRYSLPSSYLDFIISNGSGVQTEDIRVNGKDVEVVVEEDGSYTINYREETLTEWENGINVTVSVPDDWKEPYMWAWDSAQGDVFSQWPGAAMTLNNGTYTIELPNWTTGVIVNANNSSIQTMDISIEPGKDVWIIVNSEAEIQVQYSAFEGGEDTTPDQDGENGTTAGSDDTTTNAPTQDTDGDNDDDKGGNNNLLYVIIPVAVFAVIILIVTFTGNSRNKKHSQYTYEDEKEAKDIKIDDNDLDIDEDVDVDVDVDVDDIDV